MPHLAVDPMPVACEIGLALHAMVTRRTNVFDPVVLTCGKIAGGTTSNVIPETVEMLGTLRDHLRGGARDRAAGHPPGRDKYRGGAFVRGRGHDPAAAIR